MHYRVDNASLILLGAALNLQNLSMMDHKKTMIRNCNTWKTRANRTMLSEYYHYLQDRQQQFNYLNSFDRLMKYRKSYFLEFSNINFF